MSSVIRFLEIAGSKQLTPAEFAASVAALDAGSSQKQALMDRDDVALCDLLGARRELRCAIFASEED